MVLGEGGALLLIETEEHAKARSAVYAPKAAGQSLGAAGAIEAVLTVQALLHGVVPPTLNLHTRDPEIDLDVVAGQPRRGNYRYAVSNSMGIGGHNAALVFGAH